MQIICTSLQTDNHASTSPLNFLQAGCSSCRPINSVKALKVKFTKNTPVEKKSFQDFPDSGFWIKQPAKTEYDVHSLYK